MKLKSLFTAALLATFGMTVLSAEPGTTPAPAGKAIDMEHHFFHPEFIEFVKTRKEYPVWKNGSGL